MRPFHAVAALPLLALPILVSTPALPQADTPQSTSVATAASQQARQSLLERASRAAERETLEHHLAALKDRKHRAQVRQRNAAIKARKERARSVAVNVPERTAGQVVTGTKSVYQAYAASLIPASQVGCLIKLWDRESGWSVTSDNPHSSAYGIPQALPGSKMAKFGKDWRTNYKTQIKWGLSYIEGRYGSPCGAWAAFKSKGWY
jgi:hypothetical protein